MTHLFLLDSDTTLAGGARLLKRRGALPELTVLFLGENDEEESAERSSKLQKALSRRVGGGALFYGYNEGGA